MSRNTRRRESSFNRVMECTIATLKIHSGYKLIVKDNSELGEMIGIFRSAMLNEYNDIVGIKVTKEEDPNKFEIVQVSDIVSVIEKDGKKTWNRVKGGNFVASMAIATTRSFKRTTRNSNRNKVEDFGEEDSSVEVLGTNHTQEDVKKSYQEVMKETEKREKKKRKKKKHKKN